MASSKRAEGARLRSVALNAALELIDANRGAWKTTVDERAALRDLIERRGLERFVGHTSSKAPHTDDTLLTLLTDAMRAHHADGRKGLRDLLTFGSPALTAKFLAEIGYRAPSHQDAATAFAGLGQHPQAAASSARKHGREELGEQPAERNNHLAEEERPRKKLKTSNNDGQPKRSEEDISSVKTLSPNKANASLTATQEPGDDGNNVRLAENEVQKAFAALQSKKSDVENDMKESQFTSNASKVAASGSASLTALKSPSKKRGSWTLDESQRDEDDRALAEVHARKKQKNQHDAGSAEASLHSQSQPTEGLDKHIRLKGMEQSSQSRQSGIAKGGQRDQKVVEVLDSTPDFSSSEPAAALDPLGKPDTATQSKESSSVKPGAPEGSRRTASKDSSFPTPSVPYTQPKLSYSEMFTGIPPSDVHNEMTRVSKAIQDAIYFYCDDKGYDQLSFAEFEQKPSKRLESLYIQFIGAKDWKARFVELQNSEKSFRFKAGSVLQGIIGAAVYQGVFLKRLPWDVQYRFLETFGDGDRQYLERAMKDRGYDLEPYLHHAAIKQIMDAKFRETTLADHAKMLAHDLALTLDPHLRLLTKTDESKPYVDCPWVEYLQDAFTSAIIVKQRVEAADNADYEYVWLNGGEAIDLRRMQDFRKRENVVSVMATLLPGIEATYHKGFERPNTKWFVWKTQVLASLI